MMSEWISVKDKLPSDGSIVLVSWDYLAYKWEVVCEFYKDDNIFKFVCDCCDMQERLIAPPTHWFKYPESPKLKRVYPKLNEITYNIVDKFEPVLKKLSET